MKKTLIILAFCLSVSVWSQGPWTKAKGEFYTQMMFTTIPNYNTFFGNPDFEVPAEITDNTLQLYGEYGISDKTTLIVSVPLKLITVNDFEDPRIDCGGDCSKDFSETALGNIEIGIKHNFYNNKWLLSGQLTLEANTGLYDERSGIRTGYDAYTVTPLFLAGRSFGNTYVQSFIGANIRTNNYSSNFRVGGEIGHKISKRIWLIGFVDVVKSFYDGDIVLPVQNSFTGLYINDQEFGGYGLKTIAELNTNFGLTAGFGGAFFGNNVAKQAALNFGLYHKF